jgi:antitoxin component of RelBE/YafQ-DinJ toxin-antitoxin module
MNEIRTGRALHLDGLEFAQNKVTLGFKCDARTKIQLAQEAQKIGMTLSEYVDTVISSRHSLQNQSPRSTSELAPKVEMQQRQIQKLEAKVNFYENDLLKSAFKKHQGQTVEYKNSRGQDTKAEVNRIEDVYTIFLDIVNYQ